MASSVHNQLIQMQNATAQNRADQASTKETSSSINSKDFLFLLTQQLQYQDPMNPMDLDIATVESKEIRNLLN